MGKKLLSILLAVCLILSCFSFLSFAAQPINLKASYKYNKVSLEWEMKGKSYYYELFKAGKADLSDAKRVYKTKGSKTTLSKDKGSVLYSDKDVKPKQRIYYYVRVIDKQKKELYRSKSVKVLTFKLEGNIYPNVFTNSDGLLQIEWYARDNEKIKPTGYYIYRSHNGSAFKRIATTKYKKGDDFFLYQYVDSDFKGIGAVRYVVAPFFKVSGKSYYSKSYSAFANEHIAPIRGFKLTTRTKKAELSWERVKGAKNIQIFQTKNYGTEKLIATVSAKQTSYLVEKVNNKKNEYVYHLNAVDSKGNIVAQSVYCSSSDSEAMFRAASKTKNKNSFTVLNVQNKNKELNSSWTSYISDNDKKIIDKFAKKHFKDDWSDYKKATYTLKWINRNVKYANYEDYGKISGCSYVEAIFNKKLGQCLQYNGAFVAFVKYCLGYNARLIHGWRGFSEENKWQHFWGEIKINGVWTLMETGIYEKSGDWSFFCEPYKNTSGYLINLMAADEI